jgi:hypothetical protein
VPDCDPDAAPHLTVMWQNAISSRGSLTCCYGDPATAVHDAWSQPLETAVANNTRVTVWWHPGHSAERQRDAEYAAHRNPSPRAQWLCKCPGPCLVRQRHRAETSAELAATASDLIPANGPDGKLAQRPARLSVAGPWEPSPDLLAASRRGVILLTGRDASLEVLNRFTELLQDGLAGTVAVPHADVHSGRAMTMSNPIDRTFAWTALREFSPGFADVDGKESAATIDRLLAAYAAAGSTNLYDFARSWIGGDQRFAEGVGMHARDWAFNGMRSSYETAQAYGKHVERLYRTGELGNLDSHKDLFPAFLKGCKSRPAAQAPVPAPDQVTANRIAAAGAAQQSGLGVSGRGPAAPPRSAPGLSPGSPQAPPGAARRARTEQQNRGIGR